MFDRMSLSIKYSIVFVVTALLVAAAMLVSLYYFKSGVLRNEAVARKQIAQRDCGLLPCLRFVQMFDEEILVQGGVVMVQMAESAVVEGQVLVTGTILGNIPVAVNTEVFRQCHAHRARHRWTMLTVAGDATARIHQGQLRGIAGIGEFLRWMRVIRNFELVAMAIDAGLL